MYLIFMVLFSGLIGGLEHKNVDGITKEGRKNRTFFTNGESSESVPNQAGQIHCPCHSLILCSTIITSNNNKHTLTCNQNTYSVPCGGPLKGTKTGLLSFDVFSHPLCATATYPTILTDMIWKCLSLNISTTSACDGDTTAPSATTGSNCSGTLIIDSSNKTVKIPWEEETYPNFPTTLTNLKVARIQNTLLVCGSILRKPTPSQDEESILFSDYKVVCYKGTLPQLVWTVLTEMKNFTRSPMLSGGETGNKVWGVGGFTLTKTSNQVLNIDLSNGEVILKPEMIFNKNISGGCAVLIDDTYLYIIGGSGYANECEGEDCFFSADVMRNISMLNTDTGEWTTDLPRMRTTREGHQCIETVISGNRGILVAGGSCFLNRQCGFAFESISGCCNDDIHQNEDFYAGYLSSVEFFNLQTSTWSLLNNMKHTRGNVGLAIINNKVTSFNSLVYTVTQEDYFFDYTVDIVAVPMFYEELDMQNQWRNVSYPTQAVSETFISFSITNTVSGFTNECT